MERLTEEDVLLTFREAEDFLRVSRATIYRLLRAGKLVGHKVGSGWRFYKADLRRLVDGDIPHLPAGRDETRLPVGAGRGAEG